MVAIEPRRYRVPGARGDGDRYEEFVDETVPADVSGAYDLSAPVDDRYSVS